MLPLLEFVRCSSHAEQAARLGLHWSTVGCSAAGLKAPVREREEVGTEVPASLRTCLLGRELL